MKIATMRKTVRIAYEFIEASNKLDDAVRKNEYNETFGGKPFATVKQISSLLSKALADLRQNR